MVWRKALIESKGTTNFGPGVQEFTESSKPLATRARTRARLIDESRIREVLALAKRLQAFLDGETGCDTRLAFQGSWQAMEFLVRECGGTYALWTTNDYDKFVVMPKNWTPTPEIEKRIAQLERQAHEQHQATLKQEEDDERYARFLAKGVDPRNVTVYPGADKPGPVIRY